MIAKVRQEVVLDMELHQEKKKDLLQLAEVVKQTEEEEQQQQRQMRRKILLYWAACFICGMVITSAVVLGVTLGGNKDDDTTSTTTTTTTGTFGTSSGVAESDGQCSLDVTVVCDANPWTEEVEPLKQVLEEEGVITSGDLKEYIASHQQQQEQDSATTSSSAAFPHEIRIMVKSEPRNRNQQQQQRIRMETLTILQVNTTTTTSTSTDEAAPTTTTTTNTSTVVDLTPRVQGDLVDTTSGSNAAVILVDQPFWIDLTSQNNVWFSFGALATASTQGDIVCIGSGMINFTVPIKWEGGKALRCIWYG
ncbi:MAG: hypothetical protein SGARI_000196 [Bacillariaceae sp.]